MVKLLSLNTHSWMEVNALKKLYDLAEHILEKDYDVICLQEVNQSMDAELAKSTPRYEALADNPEIRKDNYALLLVFYLENMGAKYHWSWAYNHIGYDKYHEGVAILSKKPLKPRGVLISEMDDEADYHTRRALVAQTEVSGQEVTVASLHLSWYGKGFEGEWAKLERDLLDQPKPLLLLGDFNNPTDQEGYQIMMTSPLDIVDSHVSGQKVVGDHTIVADIDGWEGNDQALKVDHAFISKGVEVLSSVVMYDGGEAPIVSDHYGLAIELGKLS